MHLVAAEPRWDKLADMTPLAFRDIANRLERWRFPEHLDGVVGIAAGGVVPAALVAQRLGLAQAMLHDPDILILDEPTRGVDVGAREEMFAIIHRMVEQGMAVILISSDLPELIRLCDRILVMHHGKIVGAVGRILEGGGDGTPALA